MRFAQPQFLNWLFLLPLLVAWAVWDEKRRRERLARFVAEPLWRSVVPGFVPGARLRKILLWIVAAAFALIALARPQWGTREETSSVSGLDVMLVLDVSSSMEAEDVIPNRLRKAKHALHALVDRLQGDRFGLVAFAASAYLAAPVTTDSAYVLELLDSLSPRSVPVQGTDIGLGLQSAVSALERGGEDTGKESKQASQAVILVSDGEDHEGMAAESAKKLKDLGVQLYVLGIGTEKGAPVPVRDEMGQLRGYKKSRSGTTVVSKFHPDDLMKIASSAGGKYWNVTESESEIEELARELNSLSRGESGERKYVVYEERFQIPLVIAVILLFAELALPASRKTGIAALGAFFLLSQSGCTSKLESYFDNRKALEALKEDKTDEARRLFGQAQAKNPTAPQLNFNQGDMQMLSEDPGNADKSFEETVRGAEQQENWELAAKGRFNQGVERSKKGEMEGAIQSYVKAIDEAQRARDPKLETDARKNLELLVEQQKQQQQQQKQDQQEQKQQQQQQKQQDQQQSSKNDQKQDQKNQQNKKYEDPSQSRRRFKSQKFAPEDAERVMSELKSKERDVQQRLRQQNGKPQPSDEDW